MTRIRNIEYVVIVIIILFAMFLRGAGIGDFGRLDKAAFPSYSPYGMLPIQAPVHPDEFQLVAKPVEMLLRGQLNPKFFEYPSGLIYLNYVVFGLTGAETPLEFAPRQKENLRDYAPFCFYFIARVWSVLGGVLTVACAYSIMRIVSGRFAALAAALFVATSYISVQHAHYAKPGVPASGLMLLVLFLIVASLYSKTLVGSYRNYIFAGLVTGIAATVRYNAAAISITLFFAGLILFYRHRSAKTGLVVLLAWFLVPIMFFLGTPFALLDFSEFYRQVTYISGQFLSTAKNVPPELIVSSQEGFGILFVYLINYGIGIVASIYILIGFYGIWEQHPKRFLKENSASLFAVLIISHVAAYIFVTMRTIRPLQSDNLLILIVPQCLVLASLGAAWLYQRLPLRKTILAPLIIIPALIMPLIISLPALRLFTEPDTRNRMQAWIYENIPVGSRFLLIEPYNVPLDESLYPYQQNFNLLSFDPAQAQDYDYLLISKAYLDLLGDADEIVTDEEYRPWLNQFELIDSSFQRLAWIERPHFWGDNEAMNPIRYWHQPSLILYCLNELACEKVSNFGE